MNTLHFSIRKTGRLAEISRREDGSTYMRIAHLSPSGILKHKSLEELDPEIANALATAMNGYKEHFPEEFQK